MPQDSFEEDVERVQAVEAVPLILDVCARVTGLRFAAVARVTEERWITCAARDDLGFGLKPGDELEVHFTLCSEVRDVHDMVVIEDAETDGEHGSHPAPWRYGFRSFISAPILRADGAFFGTLCALDTEARELDTPEVRGMFTLFAQLIAAQLDAETELARSRSDLIGAQEASKLREEFIAVVGHDLRNPLAALSAGLRVLERDPAPERARGLRAEMRRTLLRMNGIIDNLLDFARGRLGDGLKAEIVDPVSLEEVIDGVAAELRAAARQPIETHVDLPGPLRCDPMRMGQLLSNLLGNAVTHGDPDTPVKVIAEVRDAALHLEVVNGGEPIPPETLESLFQPFSRGGDRPSRQGLGLGLFISSEIAKAHGGRLEAESGPEATRFVFTMPWA